MCQKCNRDVTRFVTFLQGADKFYNSYKIYKFYKIYKDYKFCRVYGEGDVKSPCRDGQGLEDGRLF